MKSRKMKSKKSKKKAGTQSLATKNQIIKIKEMQKKLKEEENKLGKIPFAEKIQSLTRKRLDKKQKAATKIQSLSRGKTTRKHTKNLEINKLKKIIIDEDNILDKLPSDLRKKIWESYTKILEEEKKNSKLLLEGAKEGNLAKVKYALDNYANIEAKNENGNIYETGMTPLHLASGKGHTYVVRILLGKGADIEAKNKDGDTPLILASEWGHPKVVKLLENYKPSTSASGKKKRKKRPKSTKKKRRH